MHNWSDDNYLGKAPAAHARFAAALRALPPEMR
jgi:hypothetical protein